MTLCALERDLPTSRRQLDAHSCHCTATCILCFICFLIVAAVSCDQLSRRPVQMQRLPICNFYSARFAFRLHASYIMCHICWAFPSSLHEGMKRSSLSLAHKICANDKMCCIHGGPKTDCFYSLQCNCSRWSEMVFAKIKTKFTRLKMRLILCTLVKYSLNIDPKLTISCSFNICPPHEEYCIHYWLHTAPVIGK